MLTDDGVDLRRCCGRSRSFTYNSFMRYLAPPSLIRYIGHLCLEFELLVFPQDDGVRVSKIQTYEATLQLSSGDQNMLSRLIYMCFGDTQGSFETFRQKSPDSSKSSAMVSPNYTLTQQSDIHDRMRGILIDWLIEYSTVVAILQQFDFAKLSNRKWFQHGK
ncbi:hypothetical protein E3N88_10053 [Mikania micrantha]|uniref:Cyclin N-terminal domain-containing protein n=1 Tax=Mikania micrantha TaxID=192012 RepID=A0A5N6PBA7_9ASTR|nr:hypothetical protein E3N88_10053 [Mikania micrantha]